MGVEVGKPKFNLIGGAVLSFLVWGIAEFIFKSEETLHALMIAIGEEVLFRHLMLSLLLTCFKKRDAFIIGSLLFAVLLHLNGDFLFNLMVKFPGSMLLYLLADRFGLQSAIACHWFYNLLVGYLLG